MKTLGPKTLGLKTLSFFAITTLMGIAALPAFAASIEGKWLRPSTGTILEYTASEHQFCGIVRSGEYEGQDFGCMTLSEAPDHYKGKVKKLDEGKVYTGKIQVNGDTMELSGCVFGGLICKSETWLRQKDE